MTMLAERKDNTVLTLADYEARIYIYKEQIGTGYIGIGRTLTEAKEAKVVPHGEWEAWVTRTTGLSPRQAQRCMQAAAEIRDGSALARLEMSKALLLLSSGLEQDEQEELARKAAEEGTGIRALQDEVKKLKLQVVESTGAAAEMKEALKTAQAERDQVAAQMRSTFSQFRERLDTETHKAYENGRTDCETEIRKDVRKEFENKIQFINSQRDIAEDACKDLRKKLNEAQQENSRKWDDGFNVGENARRELAAEIEKLKRNEADLLEAAENAERRAAEAEARAEELQAGVDPNRDAVRTLRRAVNAFLEEAEGLADPAALHGVGLLPLELCVQDLEEWCGRMRKALAKADQIAGEGVIV